MSTALYRRYRPETFSDVIGQEHVTEPLMTAISKNRVNHAYLFSGPRGCGKTTSARILARCLNCAQGPTPVPCGTCDSCVELARNGSGSLDVIEIDAASHGGVDDARDLRERATFAPVRDRYKIFIIDEAHMVTSAGFNALLKIVEEPPEHIKFIFATTEPDKVIGTIRSRTHHYPFRLVPPEPLMAYLELLCNQEDIPVAPGVLSLVVRAGGGSVRDSLSVLDQLMAGAGASGLDYELAVSLLGYTHASLLDDVVDAVAADDSATVFGAIDRVIQTGHDPRRFVEDLLERFRDLIIVNAVPDAAAAILRGIPDDQLNRMRTQAQQLGRAELSRAADITNTALTEMTGATSPRLHLELLCARILLPAADQSEQGMLARVDRIERRLSYASGLPDTGSGSPAAPSGSGRASTGVASSGAVPAAVAPAARDWASEPDVPAVPASAVPAPAAPVSAVPVSAVPAHAAQPDVPAPAEKLERATEPASQPGAADWGGGWGVPPEPSTPEQAEREQPEREQPERDPASPDVGERKSRAATPSAPAQRSGTQPAQQGDPASSQPQTGASWQPQTGASSRPEAQEPAPAGSLPAQRDQPPSAGPVPSQPQAPAPASASSVPSQPAQPQGSAPASGQIEMIRRAWPEIMDELARIKRSTWLNVNADAKPRSFSDNQLTLAFASQGNALGFQRGQHTDNLKQAISKVLGLNCSIEAIHDGAATAGEPDPKVPTSRTHPAKGQEQPRAGQSPSSGTDSPSPSARDDGWGLPSSAAPHVPTSTTPDDGWGLPATGEPQAQPQPQATAAPGAPEPAPRSRVAATPVPQVGPAPDPAPQADKVQAPATQAGHGAQAPQAGHGAAPATQAGHGAQAPQAGASPGQTPRVPGPSSPAPRAGLASDPTMQAGQEPSPKAGQAPPTATPAGPTPANRTPANPATPAPAPSAPATATPATATPATADDDWLNAEPPRDPEDPGPEEPSFEEEAPVRPSRYRQLLDEAARAEASRPQPPGRPTGAVDLKYVEDIPSADDETIEQSGLVGRQAIERILNGRLIEERSLDQ